MGNESNDGRIGRYFSSATKIPEFGIGSRFFSSPKSKKTKTKLLLNLAPKTLSDTQMLSGYGREFRRSRAEVGYKMKEEMRVAVFLKNGVEVTILFVESEHIDSVAFYFFMLFLSLPLLLFFERPLRPSHREIEVLARL
jgi:hypothetical protein